MQVMKVVLSRLRISLMVPVQHMLVGREGMVHRMCCTFFSYLIIDRLLSLQVVVECTEQVCHTQLQDAWQHQCIGILEMHTCFHDRSSPTVGSESIVCDMVNCPLPTKNVVSLYGTFSGFCKDSVFCSHAVLCVSRPSCSYSPR